MPPPYFGTKGREKERRVVELLDMVELEAKYLDRFLAELSGGQKQRVAFARALAAHPDLMICDEITSAFDQVVQGEILKLLMRLQRETSVTYMFITHDIATVRAIADEIVVMKKSVPQMDPDWLTTLLARRSEVRRGTTA
jgi:peptide/nickel transport system ATP-binding protein